MPTESNPPPGDPEQEGNWLQRLWWWARNLYRELKPCRFSFIVALIAWPVRFG